MAPAAASIREPERHLQLAETCRHGSPITLNRRPDSSQPDGRTRAGEGQVAEGAVVDQALDGRA
jgi:hypothetical protein